MILLNKVNINRLLLIVIAFIIVTSIVYFSNSMVKELAEEEKQKAELLAEAQKILVSDKLIDNQSYLFLFSIIQKNNTIPFIVTDENKKMIFSRNIPKNILDNQEILNKEITKMQKNYNPIVIKVGKNNQYLYYKNSDLHDKLQNYPFLLILLILIFVIFFWWVFKNLKKTDESLLWAAMTKETAHQIGTPLSSIIGWLELLKDKHNQSEAINEIELDVKRLEIITERFSKIGSKPELKILELNHIIENTISYLIPRISKNIIITFKSEVENINIPLNKTLFSWVIENLIKNAIDAIKTKGNININILENQTHYLLDVADNGLGIKTNEKKSIFKPGFTTKKRGWGLGLSLVKRIIEQYHKGKIYILKTEINKGTTFRIELNKNKFDKYHKKY